MGYFDGLTDVNFKETEDGKTVFYPYGILSSGYILCEEKKKGIARFIKRYNKISLGSVITTVIIVQLFDLSILLTLLLLLILVPYYIIKIKQMLSNEENIINEKMKFKERMKIMAKAMGKKTNILLFLTSLIMTGSSLYILFYTHEKLIGTIGMLFFGLGLVQSIFLIKNSKM